ncbi:MAG: L-sorbose 1-phosphate reductase [Lentisphaerae bacterium RIFOXYB12_FULL_65_16]|nr:MAG: L-sorbose 1-phosphate reductase [Lentisphaerae bacterium RIFOXYA12_64_32]OGV85179.1 MAG: L-sorbose 1-phosphate reductase [Lentisphaerae bacterium RIFOXYB12_FULL_65_16]
MKTTALRIHGKMDLRLETFELPACGDDGIIAEVLCDSLCMSSYKAAKQGPEHKRVPKDCATTPTIIGHEFAGRLLEVGKKWQKQFKPGDKFGIQPALMYKGSQDAPGYSFTTVGGDATHVRIPSCVMEMDCLLNYSGDAFFMASLAEPMSCLIGACKAQYHTDPGKYEHKMGIVKGGKMALLASAGPMGLGLIDYLLNGPRQPKLMVVTDIDQGRLDRAKSIMTPEKAKARGVELVYVNTAQGNGQQALMDLSGGMGYDDVFVMAPVAPVVEQGDAILGRDGCMNFFAGPTDPKFAAKFNFYNVHYGGTHIVGTSGGNTEDMRDALALMSAGKIDPSVMITHVGGLTAAKDSTLHLAEIPGGKKLLYTQVDLPLVAIADFAEKGKTDPLYAELAALCAKNNGMWCVDAEKVILTKAPKLKG